MSKLTIKRALKKGYITPNQLRELHEGDEFNELLTEPEIKQLDGIYNKMFTKDNGGIEISHDQKREFLRYLTKQTDNIPMKNEYYALFDIDLLTEEDQQYLIDISLKLEQTLKE